MSVHSTLDNRISGLESIAFVDGNVAQADELLGDLQVDRVFLLNDQSSGIEQITQALAQYMNLDSVHILSHGDQEELQLGNAILGQHNLRGYQAELSSWQNAFSQNGDLLFYGCNVAADDDGLAFIEQISQLTQADVAASNDVTGHADLGGDWQLEVTTGNIADVLAVESYQGILPTYNGNTYQLTSGAKTWDEAQAEAESLGGNLVTINDAAEEAWLRQTFSSAERLWIGLNDKASEGQFEWVSGEAVTYLNWAPAEPNDYNGNEDMAALNWNSQGQWNDWFPTTQVRGIIEIEGADPEPPPGNGDGLKGDYFDNQDFTDLQLTRTDATVDFNWGGGAPDPTIGVDTFSVRWTGQIEPLYSETYTFQTTTDDGVRLWVNGQLIIDQFVDQAPTSYTGDITLEAGQKYDIRLDYYENGGGAVAELHWSSDSQAFEIIPQSQLFSDDGSTPSEPSIFALQDSNTILVNEAAGTATVTVVRTGGIEEQATVEYTLNEVGEESATVDVDFTSPTFDGRPNTGQLVFAPGVAEVAFDIPIVDDALVEGDETFSVGLQNPNGGTLGAPRTQLVTILDDDTAPTISLGQATLNVAESSGTATITVQRSGNTDVTASATYTIDDGTATFGQDYDGTRSGIINFAVGQTSQTIDVSIVDDASVEANETFTITLDSATNANLGNQVTTTVSILDNDLELGDLTRTTAVAGLIEPTTLDWTHDGRYMLVAEKRGVVKVVDNGVLSSTPLIDISDQVNGTRDRGLLGLAIHPEFSSNPYVYMLYTYDPPETVGGTGLGGPDGNGNRPSRLVRVTVDPNTMVADPNSLVVLAGTNSTWEYTSSPTGNSTGDTSIAPSGIVNGTTITAPTSEIEVGTQDNDPDQPGIQNQNIRDYLATDSESHSIGDLEFGADGYLYLTNGDGTSYNFVDPRTVRVQDINNLSGKLLRIDPITGEGVAANPFYNGDGDSNQSKVFYSGLRNPFRFAFDPVTDLPVIGDVGWTSWEEINTGPAGSNFGWPYIEGPDPTGGYQDLAQAIAFYDNGNRNNPGDTAAVVPLLPRSHGAPDNANAIVVGDFYNSNTLMFGDVNNGTLYAATLDDNRQVTNVQVFDSGIPYVVDMKMGPDGILYGVDLFFGNILSWEPGDTPPSVPNLTASFDNFANTSALNLNGSAASTNGSLRLTSATNSQAGSAFLEETLQVTDATSFSTQFQFEITGGQGTNGADGLAFVLHNNDGGADFVGAGGSGVGYGGIDNSIAIEFDTYQGAGDPNNNHISLLQDGNTSSALFNANTSLDLNSGDILTAWIDYDGATDALSVYLSNNGVKPVSALVSYNIDLDDILGAEAYVGFSAGTGGLVNNHDILNWSFESNN
ncbi:MAG: DUF4347 domain-containing protein [Leptolyngbyaceae cyanobacterium MAG.088]|nr:DUF4347 domain-containing protein [Leptolyngbyaceae cyanobacterium MAG.088]